MGLLTELPGIGNGQVECRTVRSVTDAMRVKVDMATIAAGDNGSISVWLGDDGYYRTTFYRYYQLINGVNIIGTKAKLREWLKEWWPQMGDQDKLAI